MENKEYLLSKDWDCAYSLEELIEINNEILGPLNNENYCYLLTNYRKHRSDHCFGRFVLLFAKESKNTITNESRISYLQIGIREDGFTYIGDQFSIEDAVLMPINKAIDFMMNYRNFMNNMSDFEMKLHEIVNESCINVIYDHNYQLENMNKTIFTFREDNYR